MESQSELLGIDLGKRKAGHLHVKSPYGDVSFRLAGQEIEAYTEQ